MSALTKDTIRAKLHADILRMQGFKPGIHAGVNLRLGPLCRAFPEYSFPTGAVHELLAHPFHEAATAGFTAGMLAALLGDQGVALWISSSRTIFPPALQAFGIQPDRCIFLDLHKEKEILWAMEEALRCGALKAVVGEIREMSFTTSRRLQLAVEQSQVTGLVLRKYTQSLTTTACVSRWKISSLPSTPIDDLSGVGYPAWHVELLRVRNGRPSAWDLIWKGQQFQLLNPIPSAHLWPQRKAG